ncbi:hypothetical protein JCM11641_000589, partial [Rhodosporidiobolus odoratus]
MTSICYGTGGIPQPCTGWSVYDSYVTDPLYQKRFTLAWTCTFALFFLLALPSLLRFIASGEYKRSFGGWTGLIGVKQASTRDYRPLDGQEAPQPTAKTWTFPAPLRKPYLVAASLIRTIGLFTLPLPSFVSRIPFFTARQPLNCHPKRVYLPFPFSRLLLFLLVPIFILATLLPEAQLRANPNRFGFVALACLPPLFILSAKNGPVGWLLGRGWTAVNWLHRWIGRAVVLLVLLHFYFWTIQYSGSAQTAFLSGEKERRGIAALAFLLLIFVSSLPPMRRFSYPVFFTLHYLGIIGFLVYLNKHTVYAAPWATWVVVGIYTADMAGRVMSMRIRWAEAEALEGGMVKLSLPGLSGGWVGGQHLALRVFFVPPPLQHEEGTSRLRCWMADGAHAVRSMVRPFEQHPFSIATAPTGGAGDNGDRGIELYARSCGPKTWTGDLYRFVSASSPLSNISITDPSKPTKVYVPVLLEGPYGGLPLYSSNAPGGLLSSTESVLLVAGGSGMSFILGVVDELVTRRAREGKKGGRVDVVWVVRERSHVGWFAERLREVVERAQGAEIGGLRIVLRVYLTCDDSLTTTAPLSSSIPSPPTDQATTRSRLGSSDIQQPESLTALLPPFTTLHYSRPDLPSLVRDTVDRALAPCGHCFPICRCGDVGSAGRGGGGGRGEDCANDEEECVGGCGGVGNVRESGVPLRPGKDATPEMKETLETEKEPKSCCQPPPLFSRTSSSSLDFASDLDAITELPQSSSSCCAPSPAASSSPSSAAQPSSSSCGNCCTTTSPTAGTGGGGYCSGGTDGPADRLDADQDERDRVEGRRLRVRRGGLGVVVCGPGAMV